MNDSDKNDGKLPVSETVLRHTLDNLLEGMQIIGFDWKYIYVNDAMTRHGKYSREELLGHTVMEKYPGIEQTEVFKVYQRCFDERIPIHMENRFVFPDKSVGWFELSFQPVPEGIFILSVDITERKKNEERVHELNEALEQKVIERTAALESHIRQLKENEEKFQKAFQASAAGITITRLSDSTYLDVNDSFIKITGYNRDELIGHTSAELGLIADLKKREEVLQEIKDSGSARNFEITIRNRSGRVMEILSSVETVMLNGERHAINIIYDITERKTMEVELADANKELEAFSYSVSHDLRAPLRAIDGYAKIIAKDYSSVLDEDGKRFLGRIQNSTQKMGTLIDDLLAFSKLGRKPVEKARIDMNEIVGVIITELNRTNGAATHIIVDNLLPANGDRALLKQVMINLISNGIKYSSKKDAPVVEISSHETDEAVIYTVKDNGAGFDMRYADKLFGVFQRLHSASEFEGTGVGLAMVQRILSKHGGRIWATAEVDKGAAFSFSLPK